MKTDGPPPFTSTALAGSPLSLLSVTSAVTPGTAAAAAAGGGNKERKLENEPVTVVYEDDVTMNNDPLTDKDADRQHQ